MNRNSLNVLLAVLIGAVALAGSAKMVGPINAQRADLRLVYNPNVSENLPPKMALLRTFLGSFKSLVASVLWMRTESLKQEGKFQEAMELAQMITDLQPRFPEVWSFQSWNMAYNISVATHTQRERWMWVSRGVELLRDKGIPANPTSTKLYRQLGWTFLHKIGMYSDDMHWFYKQKLAEQWQLLLGSPQRAQAVQLDAQGQPMRDASGREVLEDGEIASFRAVARMDQAFFAHDLLLPEVRQSLVSMEARYPTMRELFLGLRTSDPYSFGRQVQRARSRIEARFEDIHTELVRLEQLNARMLDRAAGDPVDRLVEAYPQAQAAIELFGRLGYELDSELLNDLTRSQLRAEARAMGYPMRDPAAEDRDRLAALTAWMTDQEPQAREAREQVVLPFVRAKVIRQEYHMSPTFMLELMEGHWLDPPGQSRHATLPLDWRHPAAHGLYWSALGVLVGQDRRLADDSEYFNMLNTDRQVIHAIQALTHNGSIVFDPFTNYFSQLPDPRYIDAYMLAVDTAMGRIDPDSATPDMPESFDAGRENFLQWAVKLCYFWGAPEKAEQLYQQLLVEYQNKTGRLDRYALPLDEYVASDIIEDITSLDEAHKVIGGLIRTAIEQGYVNGRPDVAQQRLKTAQQAHVYYQKDQARKTHGASRDRMSLMPFAQIVADVLTNFMTAPHATPPQGVPLPTKELAWRNIPDYLPDNTPNPLKQRIWDRIRPTLYAQVNLFNEQMPADLPSIDPARLFPEPPDMDAYRKAHGQPEPEAVQQSVNP